LEYLTTQVYHQYGVGSRPAL